MILRDPAESAFSQYLHNVTNGLIYESFREHIYAGSRWKSEKFAVGYPSLELGLYYEQVKRYLDVFPRENVHILFFEEYQKQPARMLKELFCFLNVDPRFTPDMSQKQLEAPGAQGDRSRSFPKKVWHMAAS